MAIDAVNERIKRVASGVDPDDACTMQQRDATQQDADDALNAINTAQILVKGASGLLASEVDIEALPHNLGTPSLDVQVESAAAAEIAMPLQVTHKTTVPGAAGQGVAIPFGLTDDAVGSKMAGVVTVEWVDPTAGAEEARLTLALIIAGVLGSYYELTAGLLDLKGGGNREVSKSGAGELRIGTRLAGAVQKLVLMAGGNDCWEIDPVTFALKAVTDGSKIEGARIKPRVYALVDAADVTVTPANGDTQRLTAGAVASRNMVLTPAHWLDGEAVEIIFTQDGVGTRDWVFMPTDGGAVKWPGDVVVPWSIAANARDRLSLKYDAVANVWHAAMLPGYTA